MHKLIRITPFLTLTLVLTVTAAIGQTSTNLSSRTDIAGDSRTIQPAASGENGQDITAQRLAKTLEALERAEALIAAQQRQLDASEKVEIAQRRLIELQAATVKEQDEKIRLLEKQKRQQVSIFFGLVKIRF